MPANGFAIAREDHAALFDAASMRKRNVYRAHGLFFAATAWTRDASDAHAQRAANLPANTVGQRDGHFAADRAFLLDELRRNIDPRRFKFLAVAEAATQKIHSTHAEHCKWLRQQYDSAT